MTDLKVETGKFTSAMRADEQKASNWIARHPGWTLLLLLVQALEIAWLLLKHL